MVLPMDLLQSDSPEDREIRVTVYRDRWVSDNLDRRRLDETGGPIHFFESGYRTAATAIKDLISTEIALGDAGKLTASSLIPPYLYLWRHHIELALKFLTNMASRTVGDDRMLQADGHSPQDFLWEIATGLSLPPSFRLPRRPNHDLSSLWAELRPIVEWAAVSDDALHDGAETGRWVTRSEISIVEELLLQLHHLDPDGQGARYRHNRRGGVNLGGVLHVDIGYAHSNLERIAKLLASVSRQLSLYTSKRSDGPPLPSQSTIILLDDGRSRWAPNRPLPLGAEIVDNNPVEVRGNESEGVEGRD
jgi:hypothetical protein